MPGWGVVMPGQVDRFERQRDLVPTDQLRTTPVTIIGVGAVGSFAALNLAKMGCERLTVWDPDRVEEHNLPGQFFREADVGALKVVALRSIVRQFAGVDLQVVPERYGGGPPVAGVGIVAVDRITTRARLWQHFARMPELKLLLDARMGGNVATLHAVRPNRPREARAYEASLHTPEEILDLPCSGRTICYTVLGIASLVCASVAAFLRGEELPLQRVLDYATGSLVSVEPEEAAARPSARAVLAPRCSTFRRPGLGTRLGALAP